MLSTKLGIAVIPAAQETKAGRLQVQSQPWRLNKTPSQNKKNNK